MAWIEDPDPPPPGFSGDSAPVSPHTADQEPDFTNFIVDPGFEVGGAPWVDNDHAGIETVTDAYLGSKVMRMQWAIVQQAPPPAPPIIPLNRDGRFGQEIPLLPAGYETVSLRLSFWMRLISITGTKQQDGFLRATIWNGFFNPSGGGFFGTPPAGQFVEVQGITIPTDWTKYSVGPMLPGRLDLTLGFQGTLGDDAETPLNFNIFVELDEFSLTRSRFKKDPDNTSPYTADPV